MTYDEGAIILAMCKAHDREEAAQIGEPSPWREDFDRDPDWEQSRFLAMREAFDEARAYLAGPPEPTERLRFGSPPEPVSHPSEAWCDAYADWYHQGRA